MKALFCLITAAAGCLVQAQDAQPAETKPPPPRIEKLDGQRFRIGHVTFDAASREISFPAKVNMREGLVEFAIVHVNGKVHESLLATEASPLHINVAFTALRYKPSAELYDGGKDNKEVSAEVKRSSRIDIKLSWRADGETKHAAIREWILNQNLTDAMPAVPWVYGGGRIVEGRFLPETSGELAAVFVSESALINFSGSDNRDDEVWLPYTKRIPEIGTPVTVTISPHREL